MHRIDTNSAQKDKFGAGKNGFTTGDPQSGTPATEVSAEWLDSIQEEISAVIEDVDSGASIDKTKNNQLITAIKRIFKSAGMAASEANRGAVKIGTQSEIDEASDADVVPSAKTLFNHYRRGNILGAVSQSAGIPTGAIIERGSNANGQFVKLADGTLICRKRIDLTLTANSSLGFSWTFPTSNTGQSDYQLFCDRTSTSSSVTSANVESYNAANCSGFAFNNNSSSVQMVVHLMLLGRWY